MKIQHLRMDFDVKNGAPTVATSLWVYVENAEDLDLIIDWLQIARGAAASWTTLGKATDGTVTSHDAGKE